MPRPSNPLLVKTIHQLAISEILEKGVKNLSIRKLAKKAGVTPTTIYYYFSDKEDLLSKIKLDRIRDLDNWIIKRINPEKNATEQIRQFVYAFLDWCVQNINIAELIFEKLPNLSGEKSIIYRDYYRPFFRVVDILKKGVQSGEFNLENEKLFTSLGFAWIYGIVRMHLHDVFIPEHRNNLDKLTDSMLDFILQGIKNKEHINE
tara:strand:+ start:40 stop:651 length:612 start_codon:yes stop_codon:yes gene_type:complete